MATINLITEEEVMAMTLPEAIEQIKSYNKIASEILDKNNGFLHGMLNAEQSMFDTALKNVEIIKGLRKIK